jgi:hypothetical protein
MTKQAAKKVPALADLSANLTSTIVGTPEKVVTPKPVKSAKVPVVKVSATPKAAHIKKPTRYSPELVPMKKLPTVYPAWVKEALAVPFFQGEATKFSYLSMYLIARDLVPEYQDTTVDELVRKLVAWASNNPDTQVGKVLKDMSKTRLRDVRSRLEWAIVDVLYRYDDWLAKQPPVVELSEQGSELQTVSNL